MAPEGCNFDASQDAAEYDMKDKPPRRKADVKRDDWEIGSRATISAD